MKGVVIKSTGSWYNVFANNEMLKCRVVGKIRLDDIDATNPVAVGDWVEIDERNGEWVITKIQERKNYIVRKSTNLSKRKHIIASNLDQAIIIVTLKQPKTFTRFIDRFLLTTEMFHVPAIIIFNKIDIYGKKEMEQLNELKSVYSDLGYQCFETYIEKDDTDRFKKLLKDKTSLLTGNSGVGKSSFINKIEPGLGLKTSEISDYNQSGKHTTTFAEMFPLSFGGFVIDTPGIKGFGLIDDIEKEDLAGYFPEFRKFMANCKFHNCKHINEPNCAVKEAVENGEIAFFRYENYLTIYLDEQENYR